MLRHLHHPALDIVRQLIQPIVGLTQQLLAHLGVRAQRHRNANIDGIAALPRRELRGIAQPDMRRGLFSQSSLSLLLVKIICSVHHMASPAFSRNALIMALISVGADNEL